MGPLDAVCTRPRRMAPNSARSTAGPSGAFAGNRMTTSCSHAGTLAMERVHASATHRCQPRVDQPLTAEPGDGATPPPANGPRSMVGKPLGHTQVGDDR